MSENISIAICDDEITEIQYLSMLVRKWADKHDFMVRLSCYESAESFLFQYEGDKDVDILLLDIQMKKLDGIELARKIRAENDSLRIVFITGYPDFISDGYDVSALHYLMKPVKKDKLFEVLDRAIKNIRQTEQSLFLSINGEMHRIPFSEIRYIEAQGHYVILRTTFHEYKTKMNLSVIQKTLDNGFFRCQRSFIIGFKYVRKITRTSVVLDDMTEVPISRDLYEAANQAFIKFFP